ncbi:MAG: winged helix-turn-helix domain-containing protein [Nitrososphaerales archaeon]
MEVYEEIENGNGNGNGRRDELTIMTDLLTTMLMPRRLTHILYKTNLSYGQLKKYLGSLMQMGLAEQIDKPCRMFRITEKGRLFMQVVAVEPNNGIEHKFPTGFEFKQ